MKLNIVGGGITGCVMALKAAEAGARVQLLEASPVLGGVLKDLEVENESYFNGCQYFNDSQWLDQLDQSLSGQLQSFVHEYGSITELFGDQQFHPDFAQPVVHDTHDIQDKASTLHSQKLIDRLSLYGRHASPIIDWAEQFGMLDSLHSDCVTSMQLPRVFFKEDVSGLCEEKSRNPVVDQMTGVPRSILFPDQEKAIGLLPELGFTPFFEGLGRLLKERDITLLTSAPVKPMLSDNGHIECHSKGQHYPADLTLWCANPTGLLINTQTGKLDTPSTAMYCATALLDNEPPIEPVYHQIFSSRSSIFRLYAYPLNGQNKISVEGFLEHASLDQLETQLSDYLDFLNLPPLASPLTLHKQRRYVNFTVRDKALIEQFNQNSNSFNMLPGAWHIHGRDKKIEFLDHHLQQAMS
ncbi:NAD(P)-binding protein [Endozoicomonas arenosclerae]|uniref:NAD(P)-binding protein n=1 Tax=Endozoicomonas arenosclerae TaxID=1633495 RepID=UPI0007847FB2|nr:FAD/NAD(P)-binding protein [Endozoicomonas arenosclerae]